MTRSNYPLALVVALVLAVVAGCRRSSHAPAPNAYGAAPSPAAPMKQASWTQAAWYIDPAGSVAGASDANDCATALTPCRTWAGVIARLGTYSPRLRQTTTFTFLSSHSDDTDPVYFRPILEHGASAIIQGQLQPAVKAGTLANVTSKSRATNALLSADLGYAATQGQLIANTTHPSRAMIYKNNSGTVFTLSQPFVVNSPLSATTTEVDTWANGDAFAIYNLVAVNVVDFEPMVADANGMFNNEAYLYQLRVFDSFGSPGVNPILINGAVYVLDCTIDRILVVAPSAFYIDNGMIMNSAVRTAAFNFAATENTLGPPQTAIWGGFIAGGFSEPSAIRQGRFDYDVILGGAVQHLLVEGLLTNVAIDTGTTLSLRGTNIIYGRPPIYGAGTLNIQGPGELSYAPGAGSATATFPLSGGIKIQGQSKACLVVPGAANAFAACNLTVSASQLDTSLGATSGCLSTGAASICNYGP